MRAGTHMGKVLVQVAVSEEVARGEAGILAPKPPTKQPKAEAAPANDQLEDDTSKTAGVVGDGKNTTATVPSDGTPVEPIADDAERPATAAVAEEVSTSAPELESTETTEPTPDLFVKKIFVARSDRAYLITGGLGGFGLALAVWLANRGAKYIVLSSKRHALRAL